MRDADEHLPTPSCPKLERFIESVDAESVSVIFSSYYLSSAASAFGHTLLRINKRSVGKERRELLDTGINYSAQADTSNAVLYAFKGLFGFFKGEFQRMPYYYKVREYNDFESRDLWEYRLNLPSRSVETLVLHIWELGSTFFDYYYLSENCSYHLLGAIEVAQPSLELLNRLNWPIIPADTVKVLTEVDGLVEYVKFRPSLRGQFRKRWDGLSPAQRDFASALSRDPKTSAPAGMSNCTSRSR